MRKWVKCYDGLEIVTIYPNTSIRTKNRNISNQIRIRIFKVIKKKHLHCIFIDCHHMLELVLLLYEMSVQSCVNYIISFELDIEIHLFITVAFFYLFQFPFREKPKLFVGCCWVTLNIDHLNVTKKKIGGKSILTIIVI